ncbi:hypothetical protein M422DRAFT_54327 [Sphaerobolus stellatus SS14]|uniref:Uncharacterized protein n=1 Tax=Sphaerobolus stellatus (strain SS14) TaxID=990650 RepID=A0A0C9UJT6_SPHS4|nr:hypothetical protein M422DRAFT_54327 [Sphaerobolus stellatus SS14]
MPASTRCRSNAFSMARPCPSPSKAGRLPKLSLVIPTAPETSSRPRLTIIARSPPSPASYVPSPLSSTSSSSSSSTSPGNSPPAVSPEDQRTQRAKMVAGMILNRHTPKPCPMAGALRAATGNGKRYVNTPLRLEVC